MRIERVRGTQFYTAAASAPPTESAWDSFAAGMAPSGLFHFLAGPRTMHVGCSDTETNHCPVVTTRKL